MNKKEIAISFLKMAGSGEVEKAYDKFISVNFIHHNQYFKGDRDSLKNAMIEAHEKSPNKAIEIKYAYEDGETETVITHSHVTRQDQTLPEIMVVHIFRFEADKIAELWDLGMPIDKNSPNENGPF